MFELVIDTEAAPIVKTSEVDAHLMRTYNIGWCVMDANTGDIVKEHDYIVSDVFSDSSIMRNAYYANKLPFYWEGIRNGTVSTGSLQDVRAIVKNDCKEFGIERMWAYNCKFDYIALNSTIDACSHGYAKMFIPYGVKMLDIWELFGRTFAATKKYVKYCRDNGFVSASGNPKTSAEIAYRYLTQDNEFIEDHTALSDAKIEAYILRRCLVRKPNIKKASKWGNGWRAAAKIARTME